MTWWGALLILAVPCVVLLGITLRAETSWVKREDEE